MQMNGARNVAASLDATWTALNDSAVLKECIPGCELIEATGPNEYRVTMTSRIGPVSAKFRGWISLSDIEPPVSYKLAFEGQGGAAGFVNGSARVGLVADGATTRAEYVVTAQVGGKLAQIVPCPSSGTRTANGASRPPSTRSWMTRRHMASRAAWPSPFTRHRKDRCWSASILPGGSSVICVASRSRGT